MEWLLDSMKQSANPQCFNLRPPSSGDLRVSVSIPVEVTSGKIKKKKKQFGTLQGSHEGMNVCKALYAVKLTWGVLYKCSPVRLKKPQKGPNGHPMLI